MLPLRTIPPGNGQRDALAAHRVGRGLGGRERDVLIAGPDHQVASADSVSDPDRLGHQELALHHRNAPVALPGDHLAGLKAVTEVAQRLSQRRRLLGPGKPVEACGRGARHHALTDALDDALADALAVHREQQHGDPRPAVRGLVRGERALDRRLALAADDRGGEAGHRAGRLERPRVSGGRDHDAGVPHRERLGERVIDLGVAEHVAAHRAPASTIWAGSRSAGSRTG